MSYSVLNLKNDLTGVLHGTTNNQIQNLDGVINRAARQLLLDIDPQETIRIAQFSTPIFNTVYDYPIASDLKGNRLIDIRPQVSRLPRDIWSQAYNQAFDVTKQNIFQQSNMFTVNFNTGIKTLRVNAPYLNAPVVINQIESVTANGTWAVGGTASDVEQDNTNYAQGSGSLKFNTTTGAAYLENSTITSLDLTDQAKQSSLFSWVYIPTGSSLTSVNLLLGSSNADYYSVTVTTNQDGVAFQNGWNLCKFDWTDSTTTVGTPDVTDITYARLTLNVTADMTGCHLNGLNCIIGTVLEYEYYSKFLFRDSSSGAFQETVSDDSNLINLDTETYNLLFNLVAFLATQQQQGADALQYDGKFFKEQYDLGVAKYKQLYKSQAQKPQTTYYRTPDVSNRRFLGRRYNY